MRAGMESMLTGDSFSGVEAAQLGWANRAYPEAELEEHVLAIAQRIAQIPTDLVQINKRTVHRAMEVMGLRSSIRAGTELSAPRHPHRVDEEVRVRDPVQRAARALDERDSPFGDYRTSEATRRRLTAATI